MKDWEQDDVNDWLCKELRKCGADEGVVQSFLNETIAPYFLAIWTYKKLQEKFVDILSKYTEKGKAVDYAEHLTEARDLHEGKQAHSTL